ncbi:Uma2 family endonuclease [uncultured Alsobacter sp.]|uniref:Uma2 family endonuclease n=1 Tax=uncultured Alsobacter sp. TaxID=1748258 RepID=UPI0025E68987|nr:Uma2 family endonuclease [uncultured Alsobacter sp.]
MRQPKPVDAAMGMTVRDYLIFADARPFERFELLDGQPVAMAPTTRAHQVACRNVDYALKEQVRSRGCEVLRDFGVAASEMSIFMPQPDVMVRCGPLSGDSRWTSDPVVLFEVLSPSTAARDRGYKRDRYFEVTSLRHLVFVSPTIVRVEAWHRGDDSGWPSQPEIMTQRSEVLRLSAVGAILPLAEIYLDIDL